MAYRDRGAVWEHVLAEASQVASEPAWSYAPRLLPLDELCERIRAAIDEARAAGSPLTADLERALDEIDSKLASPGGAPTDADIARARDVARPSAERDRGALLQRVRRLSRRPRACGRRARPHAGREGRGVRRALRDPEHPLEIREGD